MRLCLLFRSQKFEKIGDQILRISQELPEKYSGEILNDFLGKIQEKYSRISQNYETQNISIIPGNYSRISGESFTRTCSREIPRKFFKASHENMITWGNS